MKISIITVTYNSASTIKDTLESVNNQTYDDIEHIIVDGLSTDNTLKIVKKYGKRVSKVISEKDNGIYDAMSKGIKAATGDVIGILNSGEKLIKNKSLRSELSKKAYLYSQIYNWDKCAKETFSFIEKTYSKQ